MGRAIAAPDVAEGVFSVGSTWEAGYQEVGETIAAGKACLLDNGPWMFWDKYFDSIKCVGKTVGKTGTFLVCFSECWFLS